MISSHSWATSFTGHWSVKNSSANRKSRPAVFTSWYWTKMRWPPNRKRWMRRKNNYERIKVFWVMLREEKMNSSRRAKNSKVGPLYSRVQNFIPTILLYPSPFYTHPLLYPSPFIPIPFYTHPLLYPSPFYIHPSFTKEGINTHPAFNTQPP